MTPPEIRKARQSAGLTQQATADLLGVSIKTVQSWEGGWRAMPEPMKRLFSALVLREKLPVGCPRVLGKSRKRKQE